MFGRKKKKSVVAQPLPTITDEKLAQVFEILAPFGLDADDDYGFTYHVLNHEYKFGNGLEWSLRETGARIIVDTYGSGQVVKVTVSNINTDQFSQEVLAQANQALRAVFA